MPNALPHVTQTNFKKGIMKFLGGKSSAEKSRSSSSMGGMMSKHYITLLFHIYVAIGTAGDVLPNDVNFNYLKKKDYIQLGNVSSLVLSTIEIVLSAYFQCKLGAYSERDTDVLDHLVQQMQRKLLAVWGLRELIQGDNHEFPVVRKNHFPVHYSASIRLFGTYLQWDTEHCERSHKDMTVHTFHRTSKRLVPLLQ
jgi:hypothetical protein